MGCGTNIVPGFNESNKIKDPGLQMKMDQLLSAQNIMSSPKKPTQGVKKSGLTGKEKANFDSLTEIPNEKFAYPNRVVGPGMLTKEEIKGLFNKTLAQNMTDEGIQVAIDKGIPYSVMYSEGQVEYAGRWDAGRDQIVIDLDPVYIGGGIVRDNLQRVILHEYGHMIMNRLLLMRMVNDESVRYRQDRNDILTQNSQQDITDFTPEFRNAFDEVKQNLRLLGIPAHRTLLRMSNEHTIDTTNEDGSYDGRLEGYYDIIDAMTLGAAHTHYHITSGHGVAYYKDINKDHPSRPYHEAAANLFEAKYNKDQYAWKRIQFEMTELAEAFDNLMSEYDGQTKMWLGEDVNTGEDIIVEKTYVRGNE